MIWSEKIQSQHRGQIEVNLSRMGQPCDNQRHLIQIHLSKYCFIHGCLARNKFRAKIINYFQYVYAKEIPNAKNMTLTGEFSAGILRTV